MLAPDGMLPVKVQVSAWFGRSESVAVTVNVNRLPSSTVLVAIGGITGALFTSFTTTVIVSEALAFGEPSSVTRMVMRLVLGPCASVGIQVNRPFVGLMLAPAGALSRSKVSCCE